MNPLPTVVLLHSSASSSRQWQALAEQLRPRFQVHAIDFHGHGSRPPWPGASPLTLADDAALVEPLLARCGGVHLVGHSYGAAVALVLASLRREAVHSVVAYEPVLFRLLADDAADRAPLNEVMGVATAVREHVVRGASAAAAERFVDFWSGARTWAAMPGGAREAVSARMRSVMWHFDAILHQPLPRERLASLALPALVLRGERSPAATRRIAQILDQVMTQARCEVLPDMGHMGPLTHASGVNRRIEKFLRSVSCRDTAAARGEGQNRAARE